MSNRKRILVVDDEPKVAFFFQQHLELSGNGYEAKAVNSGAAALEALRQTNYDLMITDLRMPQMDGLELLKLARTISPETKTILVTAFGTSEVWEEAHRLEIAKALSKPIRIPDLLQAIEDVLLGDTAMEESRIGIVVLANDSYEDLAERLRDLRVDVGAQAAIIADTTGRIIVHAGDTEEFDTSTTLALLGSTMAAAGVLSQKLAHEDEIHLSYFEGPPYDLYAANLGKDFFLTIVQKRNTSASRIGVVWLYMRRALEEITELMQVEGVEERVDLEPDFVESVQDELDSLFGEPEQEIVETAPAKVPTAAGALVVDVASPAVANAAVAVTMNLRRRVEHILSKIQQRTGLVIDAEIEPLQQPLPVVMARLLTQTITAALKNTLQHAQANHVSLSFNWSGRILRGLIVDNGVGLDSRGKPKLKTIGALQKQYEAMGGKLEIFGFPTKGTTVTLQIPLDGLGNDRMISG